MHGEMRNFIENAPSNTLELNAYQVANFLDIAGRILIENLKAGGDKNSFDPDSTFSDSELKLIGSVFKELSDNFFPMAHSQKPLRDLEIKEKGDMASLKSLMGGAQYKMEEVIEIFDELKHCIRQLEG